jgi:hypothetical protein
LLFGSISVNAKDLVHAKAPVPQVDGSTLQIAFQLFMARSVGLLLAQSFGGLLPEIR